MNSFHQKTVVLQRPAMPECRQMLRIGRKQLQQSERATCPLERNIPETGIMMKMMVEKKRKRQKRK